MHLPRRSLLGGALGLVAAVRPGVARFAYVGSVNVPDNSASVAPEVHISYGQSWRSNVFADFTTAGFNPQAQTLLALHTTSIGLPTSLPGPLPNSAGINLPGTMNGTTGFVGSDVYTIGRCAVLAQQLLRIGSGLIPLVPILECCLAYPASTWTTGAGGGLQPGGTSWTNQAAVIAAIQSLLPAGKLLDADFRSVGYTQGGAADATAATKIAELATMFDDYDGLGMASSVPLKFYLGLPAAISTATTYDASEFGTVTSCRSNAPGQGGTYSGRQYATSPSYPWAFNGADNIHTDAYGSARWGEVEGYVRHQVQDIGVAWTPLWRPLTGGVITVAGQVVTVPFARPAGTDFAATPMVWQANADDGIKVWPQYGWHVKRGGSDLTVTPAIDDMNVLLIVAETLSPSDVLEVSYAWYGPGGTNPGANSGVGGNLCMNGPASVMFPNGYNGVAKTIDAWAWPFLENVTV